MNPFKFLLFQILIFKKYIQIPFYFYRIERLIEELDKEEEVPEENYLKISIQIEKCVRYAVLLKGL